MPILIDPRKERYAQELAKPNRPKLSECYAIAGFTGGNSSRLARRPEIQARVREIQTAAAELAELDAAWLLLKAKRLADFNVDDFLTPANEHGVRYFDISRASREQLGALGELTIEEYTEGKGEAAVDVRRTKIKGEPIAAMNLIAKVMEFIRPAPDVSLTVNNAVVNQINNASSARDRIAGRIALLADRSGARADTERVE